MHAAPSPPPSAAKADRPLRVLIADDEPLILRALTRLLERRGHEVHAVPDAYQALELLGRGSFDAVLVDAQMPGGGPSVLDHLRESDYSGVAVLMTGAIAADATGISDGVRRLQKPFHFRSVIPLLEDTLPS
jgi:CheY-like chemotaxis protein